MCYFHQISKRTKKSFLKNPRIMSCFLLSHGCGCFKRCVVHECASVGTGYARYAGYACYGSAGDAGCETHGARRAGYRSSPTDTAATPVPAAGSARGPDPGQQPGPA